MSGKSTLLSLLYCAKTSNVRKVYIAITFVLWEDIQYQENLHYHHLCIVGKYLMSGKSTLLSLLYNFTKRSNVKNVYIANICILHFIYILCQESLHCNHFHTVLCEDINVMKVYTYHFV